MVISNEYTDNLEQESYNFIRMKCGSCESKKDRGYLQPNHGTKCQPTKCILDILRFGWISSAKTIDH